MKELTDVAVRFKGHTDAALRRYAHNFPESLHEPKGGTTRNFIPPADILDAVGHADQKEQILADGVAEEKAHRLLSH